MSYEWVGMKKLTLAEAILAMDDRTVYFLYDDGTEAEAEAMTGDWTSKYELYRMAEHAKYGGEFGTEYDFYNTETEEFLMSDELRLDWLWYSDELPSTVSGRNQAFREYLESRMEKNGGNLITLEEYARRNP